MFTHEMQFLPTSIVTCTVVDMAVTHIAMGIVWKF